MKVLAQTHYNGHIINQHNVNKSISIDVNETVGWCSCFTTDSDDNPMVDTEFNIIHPDGSGGSFSISGLSSDDVIYVFPTVQILMLQHDLQ